MLAALSELLKLLIYANVTEGAVESSISDVNPAAVKGLLHIWQLQRLYSGSYSKIPNWTSKASDAAFSCVFSVPYIFLEGYII